MPWWHWGRKNGLFEEREQQRGIRHSDLDLVLAYGELVEKRFLMSDKARRNASNSE